MNLRQYQQSACTATFEGFREFQRQLLVMATGGGKTICFAHLAKMFQPLKTLILCHREELLLQAQDKIQKAVGIKTELEKAEFNASLDAPIVVASVQSMMRRLDKWPADHFGLIVADEAHHCFPYSTKIMTEHGMMSIGSLVESEKQVRVYTCNLKRDAIELKHVSNWFRNPRKRLLRVVHERGCFTCTEDHKIWSGGSYVRAKVLVPGMLLRILRNSFQTDSGLSQNEKVLQQELLGEVDYITTADEGKCLEQKQEASGKEDVRMVQGGVLSSTKGKFFSQAKILLTVLRPILESLKGFIQGDGSEKHLEDAQGGYRNETPRHFKKNARAQSNEESACDFKDAKVSFWKNLFGARRKWADYQTADDAPHQNRLGIGVPNSNEGCEGEVPVAPFMLQGGFGRSRKETCGGGGRENSQLETLEVSRQKKGIHLALSRVVSVEIYECRGGQKSESSSGEDSFLYDIEVEDNHNYFAEGVLVSNCLAASWRSVLNHFTGKILGVTATPHRGDKRELGSFFENIAYEISILDLIKQGYLSPISIRTCPLEIDLTKVKQSAGDYDANQSADALAPFMGKIVKNIVQYAGDRKTLVFLPLIATSKSFVEVCQMHGINAAHVDGEMAERKEVLAAFARNEFQLLSNAQLLNEGYDQPDVDCVVMLRPTRSQPMFAQVVGRGTRIHPGKRNLLILDFLWLHERHSLIRPAHLIAGSSEEADSMTEASEHGEEQDLLALQESAKEQREAALAKELAKQKRRKGKEIRFEDFALSIHQMELAEWEPTMKWHSDPATEKQMDLLKKMGFEVEGLTKGKAHALMDTVFSRREAKLATPGQVIWLRKKGHKEPEKATFKEAKEFLDLAFSGKYSK